MRRGLAAALGLLLVANTGVSADDALPRRLTTGWLRAQIAVHGAKSVVGLLWRRHRWEAVARRIDSGREDWVRLAPVLAPGTDAGTAEELGIALALALPKNPQAVLGVLAGRMPLSIEIVCGAPFIEDTVKDVPAYLRRARAAVGAVGNRRLAQAKAACLAELAKAEGR